MTFLKKRVSKPQLTRAESLKYVPVKNMEVSESRLDNGDVLLIYPIVMRPWIGALLRKLKRPPAECQTRKLQLDALGTSMWDLIDGKRSVQQLITTFTKMHQLHGKEAQVAVTAFLLDLGKRGLIGLR